MEITICKISERPELLDLAAEWFHSKWNIPKESYMESMLASLKKDAKVPSWYLALHQDKIVGGMGVIENDFHNRRDLTPNMTRMYIHKQ